MTRATKKLLLAVLTPLLVAAGLSASMSPAASAVAYSGYTDWKAISAGGTRTCAIRTTSQLYCWGTDGTGSALYALSGYRDWKSVSVGEAHSCAIRGAGWLYCWGSDDYGQLGNGGSGSVSTPGVVGNSGDWKSVSAGRTHSCGIRGAGTLYCWGSDLSGQLGNGDGGDSQAPVLVGTLTSWRMVSTGGSHTCAIRGAGTLYCWGSDLSGQLGNGSSTTDNQQSPDDLASINDWKSVSAGGSHTCARRGAGRPYCWGSDAYGQLGNGSSTASNQTYPRPISSRDDWTSISAGGSHTCATVGAGALYCWGSNSSRQTAASGTASSYPSPLRFSTLNARAISAGLRHTCAIQASPARIYCWGAQRQPSNGTPAGTGYPAQALDLRRWKLTIPYDGSDAGTVADEIKWPTLGTYRSLSFFHTTADNKAVVFRTPVGGAKTGGSVFARSEMRERTQWTGSDQENCDWSNQSGTHRLNITQKVTHLPPRIPRVVVGQIHDPRDEVVMVRVDGSTIIAEASYPDPSYPDGRKVQKTLATGYRLGTYFTIRIQASSSGVAVYYNEGKSDARTAGFSGRVARNASPDKTTGDGWFFKAGMYLQTNTAKGEAPNEYGEGVISALSIYHSNGQCPS